MTLPLQLLVVCGLPPSFAPFLALGPHFLWSELYSCLLIDTPKKYSRNGLTISPYIDEVQFPKFLSLPLSFLFPPPPPFCVFSLSGF